MAIAKSAPYKARTVAIIGGGAAAVGALLGLRGAASDLDITLIDQPPGPTSPFQPSEPCDGVSEPEAYARFLRKTVGWSFPPPKSQFGVTPSTFEVNGRGRVWLSDAKGGLTRFWGASALPLPDDEFDAWPFDAAAMRPHYEAVVGHIGVAGADDGLSALWGHGLANRPVIKRPAIFDQLTHVLEGAKRYDSNAYRLIPGGARLALETSPEVEDRCRYLGQCMSGCPRNAVYSAAKSMVTLRRHVAREITAHVLAVDSGARTVTLDVDGRHETVGPFDHIFLCAGCLGSTVIALRSGLAGSAAVMHDTAIITFPILYLGRPLRDAQAREYFSLTNMVIACAPEDGRSRRALVQLYPVYDFLWQPYLPRRVWPVLAPFGRFARQRLIIARLCLPARDCQQYRIEIGPNGHPKLSLARVPGSLARSSALWRALRQGLGRGGFHVPKRGNVQHKTSSHYGASLPFGTVTHANGEIAPGIFLCDSAAFPEVSAFSPTLTIMAYAHRVAMQAVSMA